MKTTLAKPETVTHDWKIVDATDHILGRLSVLIANALRGRNNPLYTPHVDKRLTPISLIFQAATPDYVLGRTGGCLSKQG